MNVGMLPITFPITSSRFWCNSYESSQGGTCVEEAQLQQQQLGHPEDLWQGIGSADADMCRELARQR